MSLTLEQWTEKLVSFLPPWYFEVEAFQSAHVYAVCQMIQTMDSEIDNHIAETFILTAVADYLNAHGDERTTPRLEGELDAQYRERIRSLINQSNKVAIKTLVDQFLMVGESIILEDEYDEDRLYCDRENFFNRGEILIDTIINTFTVLLEQQIHDPWTFCDREYFCDRTEFVGQHDSSDYVLGLVLEVVNKNKALGTLFRIVERRG